MALPQTLSLSFISSPKVLFVSTYFLKSPLLILQKGLSREMFEGALKLPRGFLFAFQDTDETNEGAVALMGKRFMDTVNYLNPWKGI